MISNFVKERKTIMIIINGSQNKRFIMFPLYCSLYRETVLNYINTITESIDK